jgi:hypothetical protein
MYISSEGPFCINLTKTDFHGDAFQKKVLDINLIHIELGHLNAHNMGLSAEF